MVPPGDTSPATVTRRGVIGGTAALAAGATAGCVQRTRNLLGRRTTGQISLTIKTVPADDDRAATWIARHLVNHLGAVGIDAAIVLESEDELRRSTLINRDFDLYVARYPDQYDPDFLRPMLHSVFAEEPGWQNPFGFVDLAVDDLLDRQRRTEGGARRRAVAELLRSVAQLQPFTVIAFPDDIRAVRRDRFIGWRSPGLTSPLGYLALRPTDQNEGPSRRLRVTTTDNRVTRNYNPIAVEFRNRGTLTGLLYDPLARRSRHGTTPWLAEGWTWHETDDGGTAARVRLREGLHWHDSQPLTAADVAFTYTFLDDTSLGEGAVAAPAPRFRGRVSLVESIDAVDERTLEFTFGDTTPAVASRAFTVPVLPEREWRPHAAPVDLAGLELFEGVTEALVWDNPDPIGSGVLRFERNIVDELLVLRRFDGHFLHRGAAPDHPFDGGVSFETLVFRVAPSDGAAVELVAINEADATGTNVGSDTVPTIGRHDGVQLVVTPSRSFYHVGFNVRREPLGNARFRQAVARLVDTEFVAHTGFDGFATPTASPLAGSGWTPSDLRWRGEDPVVPFIGSDGELDVAAAQDLFREIGYQYDEDGRLLDR